METGHMATTKSKSEALANNHAYWSTRRDIMEKSHKLKI
jgi:hypothetical protein